MLYRRSLRPRRFRTRSWTSLRIMDGQRDDAVVVGPKVIAGAKGRSAEGDVDITFTRAGLTALPGDRAKCLHAEIHSGQQVAIPDGTVDDQPGPPVVDGELCDDVTRQCGVHRSGAVDEQHAAAPRGGQYGSEQRVVLKAADGRDRAREGA